MRYSSLLILLVTIFNSSAITGEKLNQVITDFLKNAATGDVEIPFPMPIADPFEFDSLTTSLPGDIFSINLDISNGYIFGLSSFRLLEVNLTSVEPKIGLNILFPSLKFHAEHYALDGNIYYAVPLKGEGVAHIEIQNLQFWGTLYMKYSTASNSILFDKLENADFSVGHIASQTEFDHNIDNIISAMIEDLLADYLNRFSKYITTTYSDTLIQFINYILLMIENS